MLGWGVRHAGIDWSPLAIVVAPLLVVSGAVVKFSITLAANATSCWLIGANTNLAFSLHQMGDLARYPLTVYSVGVRVLLTAIVPFGFVSFFPAAALLRQGTYGWAMVVTPLAAAGCLALALWVFGRGLRRYESAGS
jgi:ABC-2 type transport system permease protein